MRIRTLVLAAAFILLSLSHLSQTISTPTWWDTSWKYRVGVEVNTTDYSRFNWPVEVDLNFTDILLQKGSSGTFDINSTRVIEHNSTGGVMYEITSQFDTLAGYDAASNAVGTIIFILNGSNPQNTKRYFYIYFDIEENGAKSPAFYPSILNYSWDGEEFSVNNTNFQWLVDTIRAENTSGFYSARGSGNTIFKTVSTASKTKEYTEFQNGTTRLMFDFRNNASFTQGPLRIVVEQRGDEAYWNDPDNKTGEGFMVKKYIFYENISWMRIVTNFTNIVGQSINRSSTLAGATSFNELNSTEVFWPGGVPPASLWGNSTNPASWYGASKSGGAGIGIVHENQVGTSSYYIAYNSSANRMGASLNETAIPVGQSILQVSVIHFNATDYNKPMIKDFRDRIASPPNRTILSPDKLLFEIVASSNYSIYNRGEAALVFGNVTSDDYGQSSSVNATLDMGTPATGDDQTIILHDDGNSAHGDAVAGDKIFSNYVNITPTNQTGTWNFTVYAYDAADALLNTSSATFNVSDEYTVVTFVENPLGISGRLINATINVENIRNDTYIPGAVLNCTYGAGQLTNITDYGNGTYRLNFTSPSITGAYTLNCTASKLNNTGWDTDPFYTEDATTDMNITFSPPYANISNITWYMPENFTFTINSTNTGNASARYTNITLYLPSVASSGTTFAECGLVGIGASCIKSFNITVANQTLPGIYPINTTVSWENPDTTKSEANTTFNISVLPNPKIEVPDSIVSGMVADGETQYVGSFNVTSFGNTNASNITFSVSGLPASFIVTFTPANISTIAPNNTNIVAVNVSVPVGQAPATYTGSINASFVEGNWDNLTLEIIVPPNTTMLSSVNPLYSNISDITWYASENFTFTVNSTNTGNASAKYANITLYLPSVASGPTFYECGNISRLSLCLKSFNITVANQTAPGIYQINTTTAWMNPDLTNGESNATFNIFVLANPEIEVPQSNISGIVGDGETQEVGFFNVTSFGNTNASNITFSVSGLPASFIVTFTPANISTIAPNNTNIAAVNVTVPQTYEAGNYTGTVNVSAAGDGYDTFVLNISVPENRSWSRTPSSYIGVEVNDEGPVCVININNTGNAPINISISPSGENYTYLNETNFTLQYAETRYVLVSYNVTIPGKGIYNATYTISAQTPDTTPENLTVNISIVPYIEPTMSGSLSSVSFGQNNSVELNVNVTDQSTSGINWTIANVTAPDGIIFTSGNMTFNGTVGNTTVWVAVFPDSFNPVNASMDAPTANQRGQYNISIKSADNTGAVGTLTSQFNVHRNLTISLNTTAAKYPEGNAQCTDGTIDYEVYDIWNSTDISLNASIEIRKDNELWFENTKYEVSLNERIRQLFPICVSDAGIYTVISETVFYDDISNETVTVQKNTTFEVYSRPLTVEIVDPSFDDTNIAFRIWVKDLFGAYIAPDDMELTLFHQITLSNGTPYSVLDVSFNISDSRVTREDTIIGPKYIVGLTGLSTSESYWLSVNATYGGRTGYEENSFNPGMRTWYDVMLSLKQHERYTGEYLDFEVIVENKAGAGQDIFVEYWVSNAGTEEKSWYSASMHAYVGKDSMIYLPLKAYILPTQSIGNYWLHAKVTPTNDTSGFSWMAHDTFSVVQRPVEKPYVPETPTAAAVASASGAAAGISELYIISIMRYPKNISTVRGWTDISTIEIKNTGDLPVNNISLTLTGVPQTWYTLRPHTAQDLASGNSTAFLLEFNIPDNADIGTYDLVFTTKGNEATDEKLAHLTIFQSVEEMLLAEIRALKVRLQNLQEEMDFAGTAGKNISQVIPVLERAENEIDLAEAKVANASYEEAHNHILLTKNLLDRAEVLLKGAQYIDIVPTKIIPPWLIVIIILLAVLAAFAFIWTFRLKRRMKLFFRTPATMMRAVHLFRKEKEARQEFLAEREKLVRMQNLLEREVKDGTITESAYQELSKRAADKLKDLDKK